MFAALKILKAKGLVTKTLLIAPLRVCYSVWPAEQAKWTDFAGLTLSLLHGKDKAAALEADADIYLINPEGLEWLIGFTKTRLPSGKTKVDVDLARWKRLGFDTLVIDELSKFKHPRTNWFKALKQVRHTFGRIWGLTGSPAPNGLLDLFGQAFMLDGGRSLGKYISHYRLKYFTPSYDGFSWDLRPGADAEIHERLRPLALRMAAEDYLDMPQLLENNIYVDLPPKVRVIYDRLETDLLTKIDERVVVAANAAAASTKCRQVANGGLYLDPEVLTLTKLPKSQREWADLHTAKIDALTDLIDSLQGQPLLVAYDFAHDLHRLRQALGQDVPVIGGGTSAAVSAALADRWNKGELPVLLGHPQAMAHGLNLQGAGHHVCWHSLTWNFEHYDQLIRRVYRQGNQAPSVTVHHLLARGTIDEDVLAAVKSKRKGQQALFTALQARARKKIN